MSILCEGFNTTATVRKCIGWTAALIVAFGLTLPGVVRAESLVPNVVEDFENPSFWDDWSVNNGTWEWGVPTSGPVTGRDGQAPTKLIATVLGGNYLDNTSSRLVSPSFLVPPAAGNPRLRFWHWFNFNCGDGGTVQIKEVGTPTWNDLASYSGYSGGTWGHVQLDLAAYGGQSVELGFRFASADCWPSPVDTAPGWYIDELEVVTGTLPMLVPNTVDDFEDPIFWDEWSVNNGTWEWGVPSSGPGVGRDGAALTNMITTVLSGNYGDNTSSRLVSPSLAVPAAGSHPRLRFWHWFNFNCGDEGRVQIKPVGAGTWDDLAVYAGYSGNTWGRVLLDLGAYAGLNVELSFQFASSDCWPSPVDTAPGWYIDELEVVTGALPELAPNVAEDFEDSRFWDHWSVNNGTWEWGVPTTGPTTGWDGDPPSKMITTVLGGSYGDNTSSRLVSPSFVVPDAESNPRLRFWHWFNFNCGDEGRVQIKELDAATWSELASYAGYSGNTWGRVLLDLSAYAGKSVEIGFQFGSSDCWPSPVDTAPGWYIDELEVVTGILPVLVPNAVEHFENSSFWDEWSVNNGTWEWGVPSSGPPIGRDGGAPTTLIATVLAGNYGDNTASRLVSPSFVVPPAASNPRLRFWHWFNFNCGDGGTVQIKPVGAATWNDLATYAGNSGGTWSSPSLSLVDYADQNVELGFSFGSSDCWPSPTDTAPGWYLDELAVRIDGVIVTPTPTPSAVIGTATRTSTPTPTATTTKTATPMTEATPTPTRTATPTPAVTATAATAVATPSSTSTVSRTSTPGPSPTASCPPNAECIRGPLPITTDQEGDGSSPQDPIETRILGDCDEATIVEQPLRDHSNRGYEFLGQSIEIDTCDATPTEPIKIIFDVHRSVMRTSHQKPVTLWVYRDGKAIESCQGAVGAAIPAPCVARREQVQDGDAVRFTILTDHASPWNVGNGLDAFVCRSAKAVKGAAKLGMLETDLDAGGGTRFLHALKPGAICKPAGIDGAGAVDTSTLLQAFALKARKVCADDRTRVCSGNECPTGAKCVKQEPIATQHVVTVQTSVGTLALQAASPTTLLVPSAAGAAGATPDPLDPNAHSVATFACAKAKLADGSPTVAGRAIAVKGDADTEPTTLVLGKPSTLCSPVTFEGTAPVNDASHLVCFKAKRAGKRCANSALLNAAAPCKRETDCGGQRGTSYCQAQSKDGASSLAVSTPLEHAVGLQREVGKTTELCLPATLD